MKKLMIAAAAMAIVGSASAVTVYDYRATVRHPYLRDVRVTVGGVQYNVYTKFVTSTTLRGYLIQDEGATLNGGREDPVPMAAGGAATITGVAGVAQPENRCFLVAINQAAGRYAYPRIIPGVIEAKYYSPSFQGANSVPAQAYLWLGGELIPALNAAIGINGTDSRGTFHVFGHKGTAAAAAGAANYVAFGATALAAEGAPLFPVAGAGAAYPNAGARISNYAFTSEYLFGQFNQKAGAGAAFADCWMNGAGFGQAGSWDGGECCGWQTSSGGMSINNLQGNLKGGLFLCSENGEERMHNIAPYGTGNLILNATFAGTATAASRFDRQLWGDFDDQIGLGGAFVGPYGAATFAGANWNDLWVDGPLELGTTDCASGTFSLRRITQNMTRDLTVDADANLLVAANRAAWGAAGAIPSADRGGALSTSDGTLELLRTIKGCMLQLNRNAVLTAGSTVAAGNVAAAPNAAAVPTALFGSAFYNAYLAQ